MHAWYPVQLNMLGRQVVVVGGGRMALRRIVDLLAAGAGVDVISPVCDSELHRLMIDNHLDLQLRRYEGKADLLKADLVFAATNDEKVNRTVCEDANLLRIPCNDVGNSKRSTFITPAVLKRGKLIMTVSTSGASPGLAKRIRNELSETYGVEYEKYVDYLAELREAVHNKVDHEQSRSIIFQQILQIDLMALIKTNQLHVLRAKLEAMLDQQLKPDEWEQHLITIVNQI